MTQRIASTTSKETDTVAFVDEVVDVVVAMDGDDGDGVLERASRSASALASSTGGGDVASEMVDTVKRWELEQSQKIWDAVDAVVDFGKNVAFGSREITSAPMWTMNDAMEKATNAVKSFAEVARETLPAGTDVTKLEDAVKAVTSATSVTSAH